MNKTPSKQPYLIDIAYRYAPTQELCKLLKLNANLWLEVVDELPEEELFDQSIPDGRQDFTNANVILDFIKANGGEVTIKELEREFIKSDLMSHVTLHKWLNKYIAEKQLFRPQKGTYKLLSNGDATDNTPSSVPAVPVTPVIVPAAELPVAEKPEPVPSTEKAPVASTFEEFSKNYSHNRKSPSKLDVLKQG